MACKGIYFSDADISRIVSFLSTDLTIPVIAARMCCSRSAIVVINQRFQIRVYAGRRSTWEQVEASCRRPALGQA